MTILGYEVTLKRKAAIPSSAVHPVRSSSWFPLGLIRESFTGAWQQNVTINAAPNLLAFSAVFSCVTGIASDVAKMRIKLDRQDANGIWNEVTADSPFLPVLRKPNHYQDRIQFIEQWMVSKLLWGNAYILKQRDQRGVVNAMYVLDPYRVTPLVTDSGDVYYELHKDELAQVEDDNITIPASEIIHDRMVCLWHPLVGVPPLYACGMSATMGNKIQNNSTVFFQNLSRPGGMLTAPGHIADETAIRLKEYWESAFGGANIGRVAVAGDGLKFETFTMPAEAAQLIDQLKFTVEDVARAFHYPIFKLGGDYPPYSSNLEALNIMYYSDCLQTLIEKLELSLDEGLALPRELGTELDLDGLWRMDTSMLYDTNGKGVAGGWLKPNEARLKANLGPVAGGDSPYLQQQNYSLEALAKRDRQADPFAPAAAARQPQPPPPDDEPPEEPDDEPTEE